MPHGRPPMSTTTHLYGHFAYSTVQRPMPVPALMNALLERRGVDAIYVPLQVAPEHVAAAIAGMRHLRDFAGFCVTMPHKAAVAQLCDVLLPNAQACGVVNAVRIDPNGQFIGETLDGVGMVHALTAHRALDAATRVLLVGAGGVGQAIAVALALAGVGYITITNRTQAKPDDLAHRVRRGPPLVRLKPALLSPTGFDIVINATSLGQNGQGPLPFEVSQVSETALVADVVPVPERTPLLEAAQARGLGIVRGIEMLTPRIETAADFLGMTVHASTAHGAVTDFG